MQDIIEIKHIIRNNTLFASVRKSIKKRDEIQPYIEELKNECKNQIIGPLMLIFHYDTPVEGFDVEIGYPISEKVESELISSRILKRNEFLSVFHQGSLNKLEEAYNRVYSFMYNNGISAGMSTIEVFHKYNFKNPKDDLIEIQASIHMWNYLYKNALLKYLGKEKQNKIYSDGDKITPFTSISERILWIKKTLELLKSESTSEEQYQVLSHIALDRPKEEINQYKQEFLEKRNIQNIITMLKLKLNWIVEPSVQENYIHISKVARDRKGYDEAKNHDEKRAKYCFCRLVSEAENLPDIDPIFCYRAAGWAAQLWENILDKPIKKCEIVKSILSGDDYCDFKLYFDDKLI